MMKYSTYTWDLVQALESASPASCKTPATFIDSNGQKKQPGRNKESRNEIHLPTNHIIWRNKEETLKRTMEKEGRNTHKKVMS